MVSPLRPLLPTDPGTGERMDLHHVVEVLLAHRDHLRRTAAAQAAAEEAAA